MTAKPQGLRGLGTGGAVKRLTQKADFPMADLPNMSRLRAEKSYSAAKAACLKGLRIGNERLLAPEARRQDLVQARRPREPGAPLSIALHQVGGASQNVTSASWPARSLRHL